MKKYILISILIFSGLFLFSKVIFADSLMISNTGFEYTGYNANIRYGYPQVFQTFKPTDDFSLSSIKIRMSNGGGVYNYTNWTGMALYENTSLIATSTNIFWDAQIPTPWTFNEFTFTFSPTNLQKDVVYNFRLFIEPLDWGSFNALRTPQTDLYPDGDYGGGYSSTFPTVGTPLSDLWFEIFGSPAPIISFTYPTNTQSTSDFRYWNLEYNFVDPLAQWPYVVVQYSAATNYSSCTKNDFRYNARGCYLDSKMSIETATLTYGSLLKHQKLNIGDYKAQALLFKGFSEVPYASTPVINFNIYKTSTSTIIENFITGGSLYKSTETFVSPFIIGEGELPFNLYMATSTCPTGSLFSTAALEVIGCHIHNIIANIVNFFVDRLYSMEGYVRSLISGLVEIFPLSTIYAINNDIQMAEATGINPSLVIESRGNIVFPRTYTLLSSSTLAWVQTQVGFDYRGLINRMMYAATGILMVLISVSVIKKINQSNQQV